MKTEKECLKLIVILLKAIAYLITVPIAVSETWFHLFNRTKKDNSTSF